MDEIVTVDDALPEPGVMAAGENEQFSPLGIPLQERAIGVLNEPDCACAVTVKIPVSPVGMVIEFGVALNAIVVDEGAVDAHEGL